jgi:hypothetical protein
MSPAHDSNRTPVVDRRLPQSSAVHISAAELVAIVVEDR